MACLCLDLHKFAADLHAKARKVRKLEVGKIVDWVVLDRVSGQSADARPVNYVYPLPNSWEHVGRFLRLSRIWDLAQKDLSEEEYEELLKPMLQEHRVEGG